MPSRPHMRVGCHVPTYSAVRLQPPRLAPAVPPPAPRVTRHASASSRADRSPARRTAVRTAYPPPVPVPVRYTTKGESGVEIRNATAVCGRSGRGLSRLFQRGRLVGIADEAWACTGVHVSRLAAHLVSVPTCARALLAPFPFSLLPPAPLALQRLQNNPATRHLGSRVRSAGAPVALARFLLALVRSASDSVVRCVIRSLLSSRVPCSAEHCPCARQACSRLFALRRLLHHPLTLMYLLTGRFGRFIQSLLHQRKYVKAAWIPGRRVM